MCNLHLNMEWVMSKMNQVYGLGQGLINSLPPPQFFESTPTSTATNYEIGQIAFTGSSGAYTFYIYAGAGVWELLDTATGALYTLTGDSGTAVPSSGNIKIAGTANQVTTSASGSTVTLSLVGPYTPATYTAHGVLIGEGTSSIVATAVGATGTLLSGNTGADPTFTASPSVTGSVTAGTTLTATLGDITATNGNFVSSTSGKGIFLTSTTGAGVAASPVVVNGRSGRAVFTSVSIAAAADLTLTITNSSITASTTQVLISMSGATTGSALSIKSKTASSGSLAIVVTNGTGATTTTADIQIDFLVLNA